MQQIAKPITLQLPVEYDIRLDAFSKASQCTRDDIALQAIEDYLDMQEYQIRMIKEAVKEADSPSAVFLEHEEVVQRLKNLCYP